MAYVRSMQRKTRPGSGIASRYRALLLTHSSLEEKLSEELKRPLPDSAIVQRIKRRKLAIKDELASIDRLLDAIGAKESGLPALEHAGWPIVRDEAVLAQRTRPIQSLAAARARAGADASP